MNIAVTIPTTELWEKFEAARQEAIKRNTEDLKTSQQHAFYWRLKRRPAMFSAGCRVYFVRDGSIHGFCVVTGFGKLCSDVAVLLDPHYRQILPIDFPEFEGFRYFDREVVELQPGEIVIDEEIPAEKIEQMTETMAEREKG